MIKALSLLVARRRTGRPAVPPLALELFGLSSIVLFVFLAYGVYGFLSAGVALLLVAWRVDPS